MSYEVKEEKPWLVEENRDLRERTKEFALPNIRMYAAFPKTREAQILGKQVLRSGTSVGANFREAWRARSKAEFISKLGNSLKELEEIGYRLDLLTESRILPAPKVSSLADECDQLTTIFTTIAKKCKSS